MFLSNDMFGGLVLDASLCIKYFFGGLVTPVEHTIMLRSRTLLPLSCLLSLAFFPSIGCAQVAKPVERWEYAELRQDEGGGKRVGPNNVFMTEVQWINAEGITTVYGWEAMADKLKVPALKKDDGKDVPKQARVSSCYRVLNYLGDQGWELISHQRDRPSNGAYWVFKRRVAK